MEHLPHPHHTEPGEPPQVGQWGKYELENGDLWPSFITEVLEESPDGTRFNVKAVKVVNGVVTAGEWQYDVASGHVLYAPPGPPWPH